MAKCSIIGPSCYLLYLGRVWAMKGFAYGTFICVNAKLYVLLGVLISGIIGYLVIEYQESRKPKKEGSLWIFMIRVARFWNINHDRILMKSDYNKYFEIKATKILLCVTLIFLALRILKEIKYFMWIHILLGSGKG